MTQEDYALIAAALKDARESSGDLDRLAFTTALDIAAIYISGDLARDNPRLDRQQFLKAAGVNL